MSKSVRILLAAKRDIGDVLRFTLEQFGERQYQQYRNLIRQTIEDLAADPNHPLSKPRPEIHPKARTIHIARCGQRARHFFLYRIADDGVVELARLLYDGMELSEHLPQDFRKTSP